MIKEILKKHKLLIGFTLITIIALLARYLLRDVISGDYRDCLSPWFNILKEGGGLKALGNYPGDYNAPYMTVMALLTYLPINSLYSLKAISILFDILLAISAILIYKTICPKAKDSSKLVLYAIVLFLPQVLLNSAAWGQCDSIYTTFAMFAIYFLLKKNYFWTFVMLGLSFAFKLQVVLLLPLFIIYMVCDVVQIKPKFKIHKPQKFLYFLLIPAINFILCLPAIIMGRDIGKLMLAYVNQAGEYVDRLTLNFNNIYNYISLPFSNDAIYKWGTIITFLIFVALMLYILFHNRTWNGEKILTLGILSTVIATFLLPGMHERYLYTGEVLMVVYFFIYRKNLFIVVMANLNAFFKYLTGFWHFSFLDGFHPTITHFLFMFYFISIAFFLQKALPLFNEISKTKKPQKLTA